MDPLIITVAADSSVSYPGNTAMAPIEDVDAMAGQYLDAIGAGASIAHLHGVRHLESEIQADGRRVSNFDFDKSAQLIARMRSSGHDPIVQFGVAAARLADKIRIMESHPDMASYCFNVHDEFFQPDPRFPANEIYALHPRAELAEFVSVAAEHHVKPEVECFYTGAYWNLEFIRRQKLLTDPVWVTLFFGWPGGAWTPPTEEAVLFMVHHLPANVNWNVSIMDPVAQWKLVPLVIGLGGHVRVGWEDNPYHPDGSPSRSNAELVEHVVAVARAMGRPVADVDQARAIIGLSPR